MIDLRSDTVTTPNERMRQSAAAAEVGDDVYGEDPTVTALEEEVASLLGFEAALFVPTGTMGNQIAVRTHTNRGEEILLDRESHIYKWELGGAAQLSGVQPRTIDAGPRGLPSPEQLHDGYVAEDLHRAGTGLVTLENTHNSRGGIAIAPEPFTETAAAAGELGVPVHLDGARLLNAAVAHDVPPTAYTEAVDSALICLSKGLGAPVGSVLAGGESFIEQARRTRKLFGGGMRQAGIIAGPGRVALENIGRLADDHDNATRLAAGLAEIDGVSVNDPETNIVLVDTTATGLSAGDFLDRAAEAGVLGTEFGPSTVLFCTHQDVDAEAIETAVDRLKTALS